MNKSGILDNHNYGKVGTFLAEKIAEDSKLSFVSAYFTIYAYEALEKELDSIDSLQFLFGEPSFLASIDPGRTDKKSFRIEDEHLKLANRLKQKAVARRCAKWIRDKVEIRSIRQANLLHGKLYHIHDGHREHAVLGSSNFTSRGLGASKTTSNIELNLIVDSDRDRAELKTWFDSIWNDNGLVEDVKKEVLQYLKQLYADNNPEFIYFKTLFHIFEKFLDDEADSEQLFKQIDIPETEIWKTLFDFQKDGAKGAIHKINNHNGCILADSVGLGKTYTALAVIKYYELRNHRVLVLCPKRLRDNWTTYLAHNNSKLNPFVKDRFAYTVLSHTDLSRETGKVDGIDLATLNWANFDLIVIDESHNFRNDNKGKRDADGKRIRKSRYERLMEDIIKAGIKTKVMLLSATPVNNNLKDLRNQIYLVTEGKDDAFFKSFGIRNLNQTLIDAQKVVTDWTKQKGKKDAKELINQLHASFFTLLDELTIARSRKHIKRYYRSSLKEIGQFPKREKPKSIYSRIDLKNEFPSYDNLSDAISEYQLSLFNPSKYLLEDSKEKYADTVPNLSQVKREGFLIGMMKVNFLKRLESSVHSFNITMERTIEKIQNLQEKIDEFIAHQDNETQEIEVSQELPDLDEQDSEIVDTFEVGGKLKIKMKHLDVLAWKKDLERDREQLIGLAEEAKRITVKRDAKLAELKKLIEEKVQNPSTNTHGEANRKVVVFCAFADTANYLYDNLREWASESLNVHIALVSGGARPNQTTFGKAEFDQILINFSPRAKQREKMLDMPQDSEIDILIATDCISEGQNLQDCDTLINYDIHWNPVRIIQRFGRIDRIGSLNSAIQLVNFWPTENLDKYIKLKNRVEARMALVDIAATTEDNVLETETEELKELIKGDLSYRDKQLQRLKDEILDLEDFDESLSLNEFTLEDFRRELLAYIASKRDVLKEAPVGLYAVVPPDAEYDIIKPGVIYCLKQRQEAKDNEAINPLQPYFLVYVHDDGNVRYNFTSPKQILEIFRALCQGKQKPYKQLCDLFDRQTDNGGDMSQYNGLLGKAVSAIVARFSQKNTGNLFSGRDGKLVKASEQAKEPDDFELITWLVIKDKTTNDDAE